MSRVKKVLLSIGGVFALSALACCGTVICLPAWLQLGLVVGECPDGEVRPQATVELYGADRGVEGTLYARLSGVYWDERYEGVSTAAIGRFDAELSLLVGQEERALDCEWDALERGTLSCPLSLPEDLKDGDWTLRVRFDTPLDEDPVVDLTVPLYAPALAHVLTDRPLYEAGDTVRFRSLTLREPDLAPLDDRPGVFTVTDPSGEVVLEERSPGGAWGVADSWVPLAADAPAGTWTVTWTSGPTTASAGFEVRPFELPRLTLGLLPAEPWTGRGQTPVIEGQARYASGAPVAEAQVELELRTAGEWPIPLDWAQLRAQTDADGNFRVTLSPVPADLQGVQRVLVLATLTDAAGDQVLAAGRLILSADPLAVDAVTELADGLVPSFNNRVYLRVTTPDGRPLASQAIRVRNAWDARDEGQALTTDADGVAAMQLDPGQPVQVEVPPTPVRVAPRSAVPRAELVQVEDLLRGDAAPLAARAAAERLTARLTPCGAILEDEQAELLLVVDVPAARVEASSATGGSLSPEHEALRACALRLAQGAELPSGVWRLRLRLTAPERAARLALRVDGDADALRRAVNRVEPELRACFAGRAESGTLPHRLVLRARAGSGQLQQRWVHGAPGEPAWPELACAQQRLAGLALAAPAELDALAVLTFSVSADSEQSTRAQPTVRQAFEFIVSAEGAGETRWQAAVGAVPAVRLRPSKPALDPKEPLALEILRGPEYTGELPEGLALSQGGRELMRCPRTLKALRAAPEDTFHADCPPPQDDNAVRFVVPAEARGFLSAELHDARAVVWVRPASPLGLALSADRAQYAPGERALVSVRTTQPAVITLTGVDSLLGQLVPLPTRDALARLTAGVETDRPAFGLFDGLALASGQIRGENAAMATLQRISRLTREDPPRTYLSLTAQSPLDPTEELTHAFYEVLADAMAAVRAWERQAPEGEQLTHTRARDLWVATLDQREEQELPVGDAFGRRLELWRLPDDLLPLTHPALLVMDATRLPEDSEPWERWVREEDNR